MLLFEVVKLLFGWLVKILIDYFDFFLMIIISSWRLAVASTSRRNYFADKTATKTIRIVWTLFLSLLTVLLLLSWWLQTWMDGYVNYGEEFAGMSRRQVRRCHRLHILATSSQKRQILMLQRLGSHLLKEISTLHSSVTRSLKDIMFWYLTSHGWCIFHWTIRVIWIVYLRETFLLPGHVWRKKRSVDDVLFEYTVRLDSDLRRKTLSLRLLFINVDWLF